MKINLPKFSVILGITAAALILGVPRSSADCMPSTQATPPSIEEHNSTPLPDGTTLSRYRFTPAGYNASDTTTKYPTVLLIPPAIFKDADDTGVSSERMANTDLTGANFLVFQVEHRLANPGIIEPHDCPPPGCTSGVQPGHTYPTDISGTPAQQQGDVERQIIWALSDPKCNGSIYLVGGSSGGCHALWVSLTSAASDSSGWTESYREHIKAVVSLSGPTDLGNWIHSSGVDIAKFEDDGENYTSTLVYPSATPAKQAILTADSPTNLVSSLGTMSVPPILMTGTETDPVPWQQGSTMQSTLATAGVMNSTFHLVSSTGADSGDHAFNQWYDTDNADIPLLRCVGVEVIAFLQSY